MSVSKWTTLLRKKVEGRNRVRVSIPACKHWRRAILSLGPVENVAMWLLRTFLGGGILSWKQLGMVVSCCQPRAFWRSFVPMQWTYSKTSCERAKNSNVTGILLHEYACSTAKLSPRILYWLLVDQFKTPLSRFSLVRIPLQLSKVFNKNVIKGPTPLWASYGPGFFTDFAASTTKEFPNP